MADWSLPALTSTYTNFLTEVKNRDVDLALQFDGTTSTSLPVNTIRWDSSANRWKKWNGSAWVELTGTYALTGLTTTGNVGIGTSSPSAPLEVVGSTNGDQLRINQNGFYYRIGRESSEGLLEFYGSQSGYYGYIFSGADGEKVRIDRFGRVGIGTSSPSAALDVAGSFTGVAEFNGPANATVSFAASGSVEGKIQCGSEFMVGSTNNYPVAFVSNNTERLRIDSSGNLGIGTSSPSSLLHCAGSSDVIGSLVSSGASYAGLKFQNSSRQYTLYIRPDTNNSLVVRDETSNAARITLDSSGNVGIGTSPGYALDVAAADTTANIGYAARIRANTTAGAGAIQFTDSAATTQYGLLAFRENGIGVLNADGVSSALIFNTNSTERIRLDSSGNVIINGQGDLRFNDSDNSNWVALQAPATVASNVTWTLPATDGTADQVLKTDGSGVLEWATIAASGLLLRAPQILTSGTSYTTPANCTGIYVECVGAGGGGGGNSTYLSQGGLPIAGPGGAGGYCAKYFTVTASTSYTCAIGAGGTGGGPGASGATGGSTTFTVGGTTITANGGGGGGGQGGAGGAGGTCANGDINVTGNGAGRETSGASFFGGAVRNNAGQNTTGASGISGSGGGGGGAVPSTGNSSGGAGGAGLIRIWEFT